MTFDSQVLLLSLAELQRTAGPACRYWIALSGGLDSTVLAHALVSGRAARRTPVLAVHVDHGLHPDSGRWREHCQAFANGLGIEFTGIAVSVDTSAGLGMEAAAREARYAALRELIEPGDWLLSAHHADDQSETVLLNLMRASGAAGLAGIAGARRFAGGWLMRPLLNVSRGELEAYAGLHKLDWISDPSNDDEQFDRNFLRHEILPRFDERWPDAAGRIRRSAGLLRETAGLLAELAEVDRVRIADRSDRMSVSALRKLSPARQRNLLRHLILELGLPAPGAVHLDQIVTSLLPAREDAQPVVAWPGAVARRYRDRLYLMAANGPGTALPEVMEVSGERTKLPAGMGSLLFQKDATQGLSSQLVRQGLAVRFRVGGEKLKPLGQTHTRKLKKLLQEEGIVPWMRQCLPLLYSGDRLVAVADLWIADDAASTPGMSVTWLNRPAIH